VVRDGVATRTHPGGHAAAGDASTADHPGIPRAGSDAGPGAGASAGAVPGDLGDEEIERAIAEIRSAIRRRTAPGAR